MGGSREEWGGEGVGAEREGESGREWEKPAGMEERKNRWKRPRVSGSPPAKDRAPSLLQGQQWATPGEGQGGRRGSVLHEHRVSTPNSTAPKRGGGGCLPRMGWVRGHLQKQRNNVSTHMP